VWFPSICRWGSDVARIAFGLPLEAEERLEPEAVRHGHEIVARCSTAGELAARIDMLVTTQQRPDVAIVASTERHLTENLLAICDEAGVRLLPLVASEAERHRVLSLGLLESVDFAAEWSTIERELAVIPVRPAVEADAAATSTSVRSGTVIAVWGPAGAPGRTSVAINVAAELAAAGHSVALADVDTYSGTIAPALGLLDESPGFAAACRLAGADSLNRAELDRIGQRYESGRSGFWVLTGIGRPSRWPELSAQRVATTLELCRTWVEYTVVDVGFSLERDEEISTDLFAPRRNAAGITALREADRVLAVGAADPVGLSRFLRAHVDLIETVAEGRILVVMNKLRASAIGSNPSAQVAQTLSRFGGIEAAALVPYDSAAMDAAVLSGRTLADAAPRSPARQAIRELVGSRLVPTRVGKKRSRELKLA
jgi:MinD-like ATPase involved in chromosome partitioning or flagellar assembly